MITIGESDFIAEIKQYDKHLWIGSHDEEEIQREDYILCMSSYQISVPYDLQKSKFQSETT